MIDEDSFFTVRKKFFGVSTKNVCNERRMSSFVRDLRKLNAHECHESNVFHLNTSNRIWKGEVFLSCLKRISPSPPDVHYSGDPIAPTLGALHHVKKMCNRATCLYCKQIFE